MFYVDFNRTFFLISPRPGIRKGKSCDQVNASLTDDDNSHNNHNGIQ